MFIVLKMRDRLGSYEDPGWYAAPPGALAMAAGTDELRRDRIGVNAGPASEPGSHHDSRRG
jgi:hypothetical protein